MELLLELSVPRVPALPGLGLLGALLLGLEHEGSQRSLPGQSNKEPL